MAGTATVSVPLDPPADLFEDLLRQLRACHKSEMQRLRDDVYSLQSRILEVSSPCDNFKDNEEKDGEDFPDSLGDGGGEVQKLASDGARTKSWQGLSDSPNKDNERGWEMGKSMHVSHETGKSTTNLETWLGVRSFLG